MAKNAPTADDYTPEEDDSVYTPEDENEYAPRSANVQKGWDVSAKLANANSAFATELKFADGVPVLIAFQDDEPIVYSQHFIEQIKQGKKSHLCLSDLGQECPLCKAGFKRDIKNAFPVVVVKDGELESVVLTAGPVLMGLLAPIHQSKYSGPLSKHFVEIKRTGTGRQTKYAALSVKSDEADIDLAAFRAKFEKLEPVDIAGKVLRYSTVEHLTDVIDAID